MYRRINNEMELKGLCVFIILILKNVIKGVADLTITGSQWVLKYEGICPTAPHENGEMSLTQCMVRCTIHSTCKAIFYTADSRQCRLRDLVVLRSTIHPIQNSSTVYYENENANLLDDLDITLQEFQTVFLGNKESLTLRIFIGQSVTQPVALQRCLDHGGRLVQVLTEARQNFFASLSSALNGHGPFLIDVTNKYAADFGDINGWTTEDGQAIPVTNWAPNQPLATAHCAHMHANDNNRWHSKPCSYRATYICEI